MYSANFIRGAQETNSLLSLLRLKQKKASSAKRQNERSGKLFGSRGADEQDDKSGVDPNSERAELPDQLKFDFLLRPPPKVELSNAPAKKVDPDSRKARLARRMQEIARPGKKGKRSVSLSIEGR